MKKSRFIRMVGSDGVGLIAIVGIALGILSGCLTNSRPNGSSLPQGSYIVGSRFDESYAYKQYFVVLPGDQWNWVEYGTNAASAELCKVTLRTGSFSLVNSTLVMTLEAEAPAAVKCGFSEKDFQALKPSSKTGGVPPEYEVRNQTDSSFEAKDFFGAKTDWRVYLSMKDPFGFYD